MKRITIAALILIMIAVLASCGEQKEQAEAPEDGKGCEIAVVSESVKVKDDPFVSMAWESVKAFSQEYGMAAKIYRPEAADKEAYTAAVEEAADDGAGFIVLAGSALETTADDAQEAYPDVDFMLLDGVPHDEKDNYATADNMVSVVFAEEEAGYMAGYAAVMEGYTKLGFIGGRELPYVKRYGYGFLQGAAAAAAETETKTEMRYTYTGSQAASEETQKLAAEWYEEGTEIIFVSGGSMTDSVIDAADKAKAKVIGADLDSDRLSETVIMSASKGIDAAIQTVLKSYEDGTFSGGTAFNYAAKNDGVKLEMEKTAFSSFSSDDYDKLFRQLKNGKIELKKDTGVDSLDELTGEWVTLIQ